MGFAATDERITFFTDFGQLVTFDARTGRRIATVPLDGAVTGEDLVAVGNDVVAYRQGGNLASVNPITGRVRWTIRLDGRPRDVTLAGGRLWLLLAAPGARSGELRALDPGDGHVVTRVALPADDARSIAPAGDAPLVTTQGGALIAVRPPP